ncbi:MULTISPECIES: hypothetical protein [Streptomyces]|uniref:hypothetical protein n=1 Tax=Streptomyces TaxID=1883 RepID=UPI001487BADB|nr:MULTISPECIES: hypothetical protein [Streptomyces]
MAHGTVPARKLSAVQPLEPEPGVLVHPASDRRLAVEHWLLSTKPRERHSQIRAEWNEYGVALLPLGTLFSAVRLPGALIQALVASRKSQDIDLFLEEALQGPVICDPRGSRYYALVPASVPRTWRQAVDDWRAHAVDCLGRDAYLGVPRVDAVEPRPYESYWSVPMPSAASLCAPLSVARVIAAGVHRLAELAAASDAAPGMSPSDHS